jgi:hypothetical protein
LLRFLDSDGDLLRECRDDTGYKLPIHWLAKIGHNPNKRAGKTD